VTPATNVPGARSPVGGSACRSGRAWAVVLAVALLGLASDLGSKAVAFRTIAGVPVVVDRERVLASDSLAGHVPRHNPITVVPHVLELTLVLNRGAVFGIGAGRRWFFIGFTVAALGFAIWMFGRWTRRNDWFAHASIGLLLAGGLGNLYDRLVYACVRDFLHPLPGVRLPFGWTMPGGGREVWPYVSNLADLWLIVGIAGLMLCLWRQGRHERPAHSSGPEPA
jgi:signal peptidase II